MNSETRRFNPIIDRLFELENSLNADRLIYSNSVIASFKELTKGSANLMFKNCANKSYYCEVSFGMGKAFTINSMEVLNHDGMLDEVYLKNKLSSNLSSCLDLDKVIHFLKIMLKDIFIIDLLHSNDETYITF